MPSPPGPTHRPTATRDWRPASLDGPPPLDDCTIHLWLVCLDAPVAARHRFDRILSGQECRRADRFLATRDAQHFRAARATLRLLLGAYCAIDPAALRIATGSAGKPMLEPSAAAGNWQFNLSHSGGWALIGITRAGPIGVDLEAMRTLPDHPELARQTFAPGEVAALGALPEADRLAGFYRCWTRKEAVVKALGVGLSMPLDRFEVSVTAGAARLLSFDGEAGGQFRLWSLDPRPGFCAALALHRQAAADMRIETFIAVSSHERDR